MSIIAQARANYTFRPQQEGDLGFEKGNIINVISMPEGGWWEGELNGNYGVFPNNYVEVIQNAPPQQTIPPPLNLTNITPSEVKEAQTSVNQDDDYYSYDENSFDQGFYSSSFSAPTPKGTQQPAQQTAPKAVQQPPQATVQPQSQPGNKTSLRSAQNVKPQVNNPPVTQVNNPPSAVTNQGQQKRPGQGQVNPTTVQGFTPTPVQGFSPTTVQGFTPTPVQGFTPTPVQGFSPTPVQGFTPTPVQGFSPTTVQGFTPTPVQNFTPTPVQNFTPTPVVQGFNPTPVASNPPPQNQNAPAISKRPVNLERKVQNVPEQISFKGVLRSTSANPQPTNSQPANPQQTFTPTPVQNFTPTPVQTFTPTPVVQPTTSSLPNTDIAINAVLQGPPSILHPVGIKTVHGKYLTLEKIGDQLSAEGTTLRTKQVFVLETDGTGKFAFRTYSGKYLSVDRELTATAKSKEVNEWFSLIWKDGITFIQAANGKFISVDQRSKINLVNNVSSPNEEFELVMDIHPHINLTSQSRFITTEKEEVFAKNPTAFGRASLLTRVEGIGRGQHAIRGVTGKFWTVDSQGNVKADGNQKDESTMFAFEYYGNHLAIKSISAGKYLSIQGQGIKAVSSKVTQKEIFQLLHAAPQIVLRANNNKLVSFQGSNLMTNKEQITNESIFILEGVGDKWALKTEKELYVSVKPAQGAVQVDAKTRTATELYDLEYVEGKVAIKSNANGKYWSAKPLGAIDSKADYPSQLEFFELYFFNRPAIILQTSQQSYIGILDGVKIRTNKAKGDPFFLQFQEGKYSFKGGPPPGMFWNVGSDTRITLGQQPEWFYIEFTKGKLAIKTESNKYLRSENQGFLASVADEIKETELFDF